MNCCYSCVLEPLLRLVLFHPFPPRPSKPCQVAFGPDSVGRHFASPQQVHVTGSAPPDQTSCALKWLHLVPVLWPIFTHRATLPLLANRPTIWKAWLHTHTVLHQSTIHVMSPRMSPRWSLLDCLQHTKMEKYCRSELHKALWLFF